MLPKSHKFPMRTSFLAFRARANRFVTPHLTAYYLLPTSHPSHLSVVVPAKVSKLATTRNWLKRLTYDTLWPLIVDKNIDCVVIFKPIALRKSPTTQELVLAEISSLKLV